MTFTATVLMGVMAGHLFRPEQRPTFKFVYLTVVGLMSLACGWVWANWLGSPIIKHIWTSSMVLWAAGWSYLLLALFYAVIEVGGRRRWAFPFVVLGMGRRCFQFFAAGILAASSAAMAANAPVKVALQSPDEKTELQLQIATSGNNVLFSVKRSGQVIIEPSSFDVRVSGIGWLATAATFESAKRSIIDETADLVWGKSSRLRNHCSTATIRLRSPTGIEWTIELRAYDDGVALRYGFPAQNTLRTLAIEEENIAFRLADDPTTLFVVCDSYNTSHETLYSRKRLSELPTKKLIETPLLALWKSGLAAAITEARLRDFAGMYLQRSDGTTNILRTRLSPLPGQSDALVISPTPLWSPWRVVLIGERAGKLIESNVLLCLNDPPEGEFSWVKPGKTTFHWWNGTVEHGPPSLPATNLAVHKKYIDFCAANHVAYHSVISVAGSRPWYVQGDPPGFDPRPDTDITTPRPDLDLPSVLDYSKAHGVGIRLWVHWKPLSERLEEAFAAYERWGIKGLMVDFMDRDDQAMVEWQEAVLKAAAKHKLHIQFHGSFKPTGEQRTYPNLFNREGVLNLEYVKWTSACDPQHNLNVAYTRALAGPMDYHLGGFRSASRSRFQPRNELPFVLGTRCHHLAMYVVYENPMPMLVDIPEAYRGQPGFEFLTEVPTTWDETRFIAGEPGEFVVVARRSGRNWYLGGMTNWTKRDLVIPLDFLGSGSFAMALYLDGSLDEEDPNAIGFEHRKMSSAVPLRASLAPGGGVAAVFRPL